jgi:hypothetical protein
MSYKSLGKLDPSLYGEKVIDPQRSLEQIAQMVPLSRDYQKCLVANGGAITFGQGAIFKTVEPSPLNDKRGYQSLEVMYGPGEAENSILAEYARYADELPHGFVPIGETPGGNLVCLNEQGMVYLWDHEEPGDNASWLICGDIDSFMNSLGPDDAPLELDGGIIGSESWLDL